MTQSRKHRGYASQRIVAEFLADRGWPFATARGAGEQGSDILHTPGLHIEVKARRGLNLPGWLRHADNGEDGELPVLVIRGDGQGPGTVAQWAMVVPLGLGATMLNLLQGVRTATTALDLDSPESVQQYLRNLLEDVDRALG